MSKDSAKPTDPDYFSSFNSDEDVENEAAEAARAQERADFARMLGESLKGGQKKLKVGDKIAGKILSIGEEDVYVSTGTQNDGVMRKLELLEADGTCKYKVDDLVSVYVTQVRGTDVRLSKNPTDRNLAKDLEEAFEMRVPIQGRVVELVKGGVRVNVKGKLAFCPISQLDSKHIETADEYVGKSFDFRITQFSEGGRNIIVSRRKLMDEEREVGSASFIEEHKDGDIVTGKVTRLEKFGAFVELAPGVDGLVHISEIAWSRIGDPSEVLAVGQPVTAKLLKREVMNGKLKLSLSIKQATAREPLAVQGSGGTPAFGPGAPAKPEPVAKFKVGQVLEGKVVRKEVYGLFIEIEPGTNGLLHKSRTFDSPDFRMEKIKVGETMQVQISEIKPDERQIALQLPRDAGEDDWKQHQQAAVESSTKSIGSLGSLGEQWKAALAKKK